MNIKTSLVTGASTGIGRATAIELARGGIEVFLIARSLSGLTETKKQIESFGGKAEIIQADLSTVQEINNLIEQIKDKISVLDILVNIAGLWHDKEDVYAGKDYETFNQEIILSTLSVGLLAPMLLSHALVKLMPKHGKIINLSGTFENGAKGWLPYYVSKKAIEDLTIGLSEELKDRGIQVNGVSPSDTATDAYKHYFPQYIADAVEPQIIAKFIAQLCSEAGSENTGKIYVIKKGKEPFEAFHY